MSATLINELKEHFRGLKRTVQSVSAGETSIKTGKEPLSFGLYRYLSLKLLEKGKKDFQFAHFFIVLCWNLMCRSNNVFGIDYRHMNWRDDALCIYFSQTKTDQLGERPKDPRHVYPNPHVPEICPVLALGLYWLTFSFDTSSKLFPGNSQYDRFRKALQRIANLEQVKQHLEELGLDSSDICSNSMRKGSATFCSSGSTSCPSSSAIHLRAGWAMGGVQDTYIRYEAAGDMYVGRTVSGLPRDRAEFASVGPYFKDNDEIQAGMEKVFPNLPDNLKEIGKNVLASLVYHSDFLLQTLPANDAVLKSVLFRDRNLLSSLKSLAIVSLPGDSNGRFATGVPPHISIITEMRNIQGKILEILPTVNNSVDMTIAGIIKELENRAIGAGTVTRDGLEGLLRATLEQVLAERGVALSNQTEDNLVENDAEVENDVVYTHNGYLIKLPVGFKLPSGTVEVAWQNWMLRDTIKRIPKLRNCSSVDFTDKNQRKRFSDFGFLMRLIENNARENNLWVVNPSIQQLNAMYKSWMDNVNIPEVTEKGRARRKGQLKWSSVVTFLKR